MSHQRITDVALEKTSFRNDFKKLPPEIRALAADRIPRLMDESSKGTLRLHSLNGYRPKVYKLDIQSGRGKRWQGTRPSRIHQLDGDDRELAGQHGDE